MKRALAFDIGGTKIYYTVIDENGNITKDITKNNTPKSIDGISNIIKDAIKKYESEVDVVAIATAGAVNNENTAVLGSTGNLVENYSSLNFQSFSKKPVFVENDANSAAWAEYRLGASKGCLNSVMLTLGTGVGGGIIVNGKLLKGKSGAAGEMHFKMYSDERRKCTCGAYDCFEIYASGNGLRLTGIDITGNSEITTYDIINGVNNQDTTMLDIFNRWQRDIALGITGLANIFDPDCFILSGSMAEFVNTDYLENMVNKDVITSKTTIKKSSTGNYSGMIGVSLLAFDSLKG